MTPLEPLDRQVPAALPRPDAIHLAFVFRQPVVEGIAFAAGALAFDEAAFDGAVEPAGQRAGMGLRIVGGPRLLSNWMVSTLEE
jgi:hypothetical protein